VKYDRKEREIKKNGVEEMIRISQITLAKFSCSQNPVRSEPIDWSLYNKGEIIQPLVLILAKEKSLKLGKKRED